MVAVAVSPPVERRRLVVVGSRPEPLVAGRSPGSVYRRRRIAAVAFLLVALLALGVAARGLLGPMGVAGGRSARPGPVYIVQPGDTFWDIARRLDPGADPRPLVARMVAAHGGPALRAGERVAVPPS